MVHHLVQVVAQEQIILAAAEASRSAAVDSSASAISWSKRAKGSRAAAVETGHFNKRR